MIKHHQTNNTFEYNTDLPKYTLTEIVNEIKNIPQKDIDKICSQKNIDSQYITDILKEPDFFSFEMYSAASKLLNKSIKELTAFSNEKHEIKFRGKPTQENRNAISFIFDLFEEVIINQRLAGSKQNELKS
jgi:hypothetical protein